MPTLRCAELYGVAPEQADIQFEPNVLTIRGTRRASFDPFHGGELRVFSTERVQGTFARAIRIPELVDVEGINASFVNGLLTVVVPKARGAQDHDSHH